jgi:hypothetical protein
MKRWRQVGFLAALAIAGGWALHRMSARLAVYRSTERACAAADARDWAAALAASPADLPPTVAGLRATDCRCMALIATGRRQECMALLERQLAAPQARDWLPRPSLTAVLVATRRHQGNIPGARQLATQGVDRSPAHLPLLLLEGQLRLQLEPPRDALRAMAARLPRAGEHAPRLRFFLAIEALTRSEWEEARVILGEQAPAPPHRDGWFALRLQALARTGRANELLEAAESWARAGGNAALAHATYAHQLSITQQRDPRGRDVTELLREAVEAGDRIGDPDLLKGVYMRYVGMLALQGQQEEALRRFDEGVERFGSLAPLDRADLARTGGPPPSDEANRGLALWFDVPDPQPGDRLLLSPDGDEPHDAAFRAVPVPASGSLRVVTRFGTWPLRWVLRDARDAVLGSGAVWPAAGATAQTPTHVRIERRAPIPDAVSSLTPRATAGRRRLFVAILDCADWRFVRYGLARNELPTFAALTSNGAQGVLLSRPPFTAVAIQAIARPGARGVEGVFGVLHQLGAEVAGLNFVGSNPVGGLAWLLPGAADLFETLGAGELRTANLLHSYGGLQVGRHGELVGPHGFRGAVPLAASRPLRADELALLPTANAENARLLAEMAADFDNAVRLAAGRDVDLVVLRVASLDLLTHGNFPATAAAGQDDGRPLLFRIYRYLDRRLGEVYRTLDGNDVLVVMSDHGIRTALEHDEEAMFVAVGGGVPAGRFAGRPEIRGVPRMIADFFAVATDWPSTGVESWLHVGEPPARQAGATP